MVGSRQGQPEMLKLQQGHAVEIGEDCLQTRHTAQAERNEDKKTLRCSPATVSLKKMYERTGNVYENKQSRS